MQYLKYDRFSLVSRRNTRGKLATNFREYELLKFPKSQTFAKTTKNSRKFVPLKYIIDSFHIIQLGTLKRCASKGATTIPA